VVTNRQRKTAKSTRMSREALSTPQNNRGAAKVARKRGTIARKTVGGSAELKRMKKTPRVAEQMKGKWMVDSK